MKKFLLLALVATNAFAADAVVEYFHPGFNHYFLTANKEEQVKLDNEFSDIFPMPIKWHRTGIVYETPELSNDTVPVCRFFSVNFHPLSSHFYTANKEECELVKQNKDWLYEGIAFNAVLPINEVCPANLQPITRYYNNGKQKAPNHRFVIDGEAASIMEQANWIKEGVVFCVNGHNIALSETSKLIGSLWTFTYKYGKYDYTDTFAFTQIVSNNNSTYPFIALGKNKYGYPTQAAYSFEYNKIIVISPMAFTRDVFLIDVNNNTVTGCYYFDYGQDQVITELCSLAVGFRPS
jgi:Repeat of unknown function (DUF5648)